MGFSIYSNSGKVNYGIKHYILDTEEDLKKVPKNCEAGSTIYITTTANYYMLNNSKQWVKINSGGNGNTQPVNPIDDIDLLIYDGGSPE